MGLPYWVFPQDGRFHLLVDVEDLAEVTREVADYDREVLDDRSPDELLSHETQSEAPAEDSMGLIAGLRDDGNRLAAVRGIVIGTVVGIIIWAAILWVAKGVLVG
jgi:hypothetical protein